MFIPNVYTSWLVSLSPSLFILAFSAKFSNESPLFKGDYEQYHSLSANTIPK